MAKNNKHQTGGASLNNLALAIADAARMKVINEVMDTYEFKNDPHQIKPAEHLFTRLVDGRNKVIARAIETFKPRNSITDPTKTEHILAEILNVDANWVALFDGVYSGTIYGSLLVGVEDHTAVQTVLAIMTRKYGLVDDPILGKAGKKIPNHPVVEARRKQFVEQGYKSCC